MKTKDNTIIFYDFLFSASVASGADGTKVTALDRKSASKFCPGDWGLALNKL